MFRGTTPKFKIPIETELDLEDVENLHLTFKGAGTDNAEITFKLKDVILKTEEKEIYVTLTQAQTLEFASGKAWVQLRVLMNDGSSYTHDPILINIKDILEDGEIFADD